MAIGENFDFSLRIHTPRGKWYPLPNIPATNTKMDTHKM